MPRILKQEFVLKDTLTTTKLSPLDVEDHGIYNFLSPYPTNVTYQLWLRFAR